MNRSFSKIRHIQESNLRLEKRMLSEQYYPTDEERYAKAGYKEVTKINLPDGTYIGNPDGSATINSQENLNNAGDIHIYNNNQRTGYVIKFNNPSRSGYKNVEINIRGGNQDTFEGKVYYKDLGYKPTPQQPTKQQPTSQNPLCNSNTGTGGTGTKTPYMVCVWKDQFATYIKLTDTTKGTTLISVNEQNFAKANTLFFDKVDAVLPGKRIGIDLPMPINPDN